MQYYQKRFSFIVLFLCMILLLAGCGNTADNAKKELHEMNIEYTADAFIDAIENCLGKIIKHRSWQRLILERGT